MEYTDLIPANDFCYHHQVSYTFINQLHEAGLIEVVTIEENIFLRVDDLKEVEKLTNFYTGMDINVEGIEVISRLLKQINEMRQEMRRLQNRLNIYE